MSNRKEWFGWGCSWGRFNLWVLPRPSYLIPCCRLSRMICNVTNPCVLTMREFSSIVGNLPLLQILCRCRETVCLGPVGRSGGGSGRGGPQAGQRFTARRVGGPDLVGCQVIGGNFGRAQLPTVPLAVHIRSLLDVPVDSVWDLHYSAHPVPLPIAIQTRYSSGP